MNISESSVVTHNDKAHQASKGSFQIEISNKLCTLAKRDLKMVQELF